MGPTLLEFLLLGDAEGVSLSYYVEQCWDGDATTAYRLMEALGSAAASTGADLPWEVVLGNGDVHFVLTDRARALEFLTALNHLPRLDLELEMFT